MQMERLRFPARNSVYIDPHQKRCACRINPHPRFLNSFTRRRRGERSIALLHMPARQQPPEQTVVVNRQHAILFRMEDQRRTGDVTGTKLQRRKWLRCVDKKMMYQILAFRSHPVIARIEIFNYL